MKTINIFFWCACVAAFLLPFPFLIQAGYKLGREDDQGLGFAFEAIPLTIFLCLFTSLIAFIIFIGFLKRVSWLALIALSLAWFVNCLSVVASRSIGQHIRRYEVSDNRQRACLVIAAIERYKNANGRLPESLRELREPIELNVYYANTVGHIEYEIRQNEPHVFYRDGWYIYSYNWRAKIWEKSD